MMDFVPRITTFDTPPTPDEEALMFTPATLPLNEFYKVGIFIGSNGICIHLLYIVGQCLFRTLDTEGGNHHFFNHLGHSASVH